MIICYCLFIRVKYIIQIYYLLFGNDVYYEELFEHPDYFLRWKSDWTEDANIQKYFLHQKLMLPVFSQVLLV